MTVPDPPWQAAPRARPARAPLSQDAIVHAALRVLDREGAAGLSMRRVADELGTGPASLYWHVANKDALIDLIVDRVAGEVPPPRAGGGSRTAGRSSSGTGCSGSGTCSDATRAWPP